MRRRLPSLLALCALLPTALLAQHAQHAQHGGAGGPPARQASARAAAAPRVVTVRTLDYAFEAPATIPAGATTFRIENAGKELHHVWLVQLQQGKTPEDYLQAMQAVMKGEAPMPTWAIDVGGPNAAAPGLLADGTVTLEPGHYVLLCHIPAPDGQLHSAKGMVRPLTVTPVRTPAAAPRADVTMTLRDYDFVLSRPVTAGRHTMRIVNAADQPHEVFVARLLPGRTAHDVLQWIEQGMQGAPPMVPLGGATGLAKGRGMQFTADFEPGEYGLFCFVPDAKDGKPHVAHGMVKQITVAAGARKTRTAAR